ncbi:MAG: DUF1638 domain-containing protein [Ilumatobacteraceae bacterium]
MNRPLVLACGALVRELRAVLHEAGLVDAVEVQYLPAPLHNRPERIVPELERLLADVPVDRPIFIGYADCGTGGLLDAMIERSAHHIVRLPGSHCYEFFAGSERFAQLHDEEIGTLYLTDFLAKHFDALVWQGLGLDRHPELLEMYFGNYRRLVLLAQSGDAGVESAARAAADRLGLSFLVEPTGLDHFSAPVRVALTKVAC